MVALKVAAFIALCLVSLASGVYLWNEYRRYRLEKTAEETCRPDDPVLKEFLKGRPAIESWKSIQDFVRHCKADIMEGGGFSALR